MTQCRAITFGPTPAVEAVAELAALRRPVAVSAGAWHGDVLELSFEQRVETLDVTTYGDAAPRYVPGLRSATIRMRTVYDPDVGPPPLVPLCIDERLDGRRLTGQFLVTSYGMIGTLGGLALVEMTAISTGPFLVEPLRSDAPAPAARRAIDLGGLVVPGGGMEP